MSAHLPAPAPDALAASQALSDLVANEIRSHDGWISFARFMERVLYAPRLGYYSGGSVKLGKDGDFTTAPEISPLFGSALAGAIAPVLEQAGAHVLEFGAGSGKLARDILAELTARGVPVESYAILDLSGELRARQQETLRDFPQVVWLDRLPERFSGVVLGNEVLDAMPVQLVVRREGGWDERGVALGETGFVFRDRPAEASLAAQIPEGEGLPPGYLTEVHPQACAFMRALGERLDKGAAFFIDYGFPAREYYHPQRSQGTLMCHYRHHAHSDPFYLPGLQDITAHVDFSAITAAAVEGGLEPLCYASQAAFLLQAGIGELLMRYDPSDTLRYLPQATALQKLVSPAEMGELFKVLVVGRAVELAPELARCDRSYRL